MVSVQRSVYGKKWNDLPPSTKGVGPLLPEDYYQFSGELVLKCGPHAVCPAMTYSGFFPLPGNLLVRVCDFSLSILNTQGSCVGYMCSLCRAGETL